MYVYVFWVTIRTILFRVGRKPAILGSVPVGKGQLGHTGANRRGDNTDCSLYYTETPLKEDNLNCSNKN